MENVIAILDILGIENNIIMVAVILAGYFLSKLFYEKLTFSDKTEPQELKVGKKEFLERRGSVKSKILILMYMFVNVTGICIVLGVFLSLFPGNIMCYFVPKIKKVSLLAAFVYCMLRIIITIAISNKFDEFLNKSITLEKTLRIYKIVVWCNYYMHYRIKDNLTSCFTILYLFFCSVIAVFIIIIESVFTMETISQIVAFGMWLWAMLSFFWTPIFFRKIQDYQLTMFKVTALKIITESGTIEASKLIRKKNTIEYYQLKDDTGIKGIILTENVKIEQSIQFFKNRNIELMEFWFPDSQNTKVFTLVKKKLFRRLKVLWLRYNRRR